MDVKQRRQHVLGLARQDGRYQFGQPAISRQYVPESVGCGPNAIQVAGLSWGKRVTMDYVLAAAGFPDIKAQGGLYTHQMTKALRAMGLDYEGVYDPEPRDLTEIAKHRGPVVFLCEYLSWPQWKGYEINGKTADGKPNGYARPFGRAGRNDLWFGAGHYGVLLSSMYRPHLNDIDVWLRDPDHNSAYRPETPQWDVVNGKQWDKLFGSAANFSSVGTYAAIPKNSL